MIAVVPEAAAATALSAFADEAFAPAIIGEVVAVDDDGPRYLEVPPRGGG
jgi:hypothetical protein